MDDLSFLIGFSGVQQAITDLGRLDKRVDHLENEFNNLGRSVDKGNRSVKGMRAPTRGLSSAMSSLGQQVPIVGQAMAFLSNPIGLAAAAIGLLAKGAFEATKKSADLTESLQNLKAITGASAEDLEFYKSQALELGPTYLSSAKDVVEANKLVGSAKPELLENSAALSEVTEQVLLLRGASKTLTTDQSTKALTKVLNQWGLGANAAAGTVDILAASAKFGAVEIPSLTDAMAEFGPIAKQAGINIAAAAAAVELLGANGIQGAKAGTQFKGVLLALETAADRNLRPSVVGLSKAMENLSARNLDAQGFKDFFGKENLVAAQILSGNVGELSELMGKLNNEASGVALSQFKDNTNNLNDAVKKLGISWDNFLISGGTRLEPFAMSVVEAFQAILDNSDKIAAGLEKSLGPAIEAISDGFSGFMELVNEINMVLVDLGITTDAQVDGWELLGQVIGMGVSPVLSMTTAVIELIDTLRVVSSEVNRFTNEALNLIGLEDLFDQSLIDEMDATASRMQLINDATKMLQTSLGATDSEVEAFKKTLVGFNPFAMSQAETVDYLIGKYREFKTAAEEIGPALGGAAPTGNGGVNMPKFAEIYGVSAKDEEEILATYGDLFEEIDNLNAAQVVGFAEFGNQIGSSLGEAATRLVHEGEVIKNALEQMKESFKSTGMTIGVEFAKNIGKAIAGSATMADAFRAAVQAMVPEAFRLAGIFLMQTGVGLGFPAGLVPFIAGAGLLGLSGLTAGIFEGRNEIRNARPQPLQAPNPVSGEVAPRGISGIGSGSGGINITVINELDGRDLAANVTTIQKENKQKQTG